MAYTDAQRREMEALYASGKYFVETKVEIGGREFFDDQIISIEVTRQKLKSGTELIGNAIAGEIDISLRVDGRIFDVNAAIKPYMRMVKVDGDRTVPLYWIQKGVFYIDTREINADRTITTIHGYDFMTKFDVECTLPSYMSARGSSISSLTLLNDMSNLFGFTHTLTTSDESSFSYPRINLDVDTLTYRELLEEIASASFGNFVFNDDGVLELVQISYQSPSFFLVDEDGNYITFGGTRILTR